MPRFAHQEELHLPATFVRYVPGRLHPDGRRYLPLLIFDIGAAAPLGVVDRHHIVPPDLAGRIGRDAAVDWMVVAAIPLQDLALQAEPAW